jgi:hypothetical protein
LHRRLGGLPEHSRGVITSVLISFFGTIIWCPLYITSSYYK